MQKKVLLVDDESSLRRSLFLSLSQEGYVIEPCENGVSALKKLNLYKNSGNDFDTIVLDIKLPDIDGIKLGKIFRSKCPDTKIIFITGYSDNLDRLEIQNISSSRVLEKPFTAKELTSQIEEIIKEDEVVVHQPAPVQLPEVPAKKEITTYSAYAVLKLDEKADFFKIYRELYFHNNVLYCDATKGEYDIFLLIQAGSYDECKEICERDIKNIDGVKELDFLEVVNPVLDDSLRNILSLFSIETSEFQGRDMKNVVCSYVLVEIEKEKLETLYPTLYFDDNIIYCDYTESKYSLVLFVQGTQFSEIDNLIKNKIATLDGVLKVKEFPIITIFEM